MGSSGDTTWAVHTLSNLRQAKIAFDPNGKWWFRLAELHRVLERTLGDALLLTAPSLGAGLDGLVGLYGAEKLLLDMMDDPEAVLGAMEQINEAYTQALNACNALFEVGKYGSATRHGMLSGGVAGVPQCDVSCMLSPAMFERFAMPCIRHEIALLDAAEYHLDGPGALRHLEALAGIPKLRAVQWVAGAGEAKARDWTHIYKKVISLGKGLIRWGSAEAVAKMQSELGSKDIYFHVDGIKTRMEAQAFLGEMEAL
jgi:5-methyltetrahydrofolate--homocysteine methyltransferase